MPLSVACPHCGYAIDPPDGAGGSVRCPRCNRSFVVASPAGEEEQAAGRRLPRPPRRPSGHGATATLLMILGLLTWAGLALLVCGGGLLFLSALGRASGAPQEAALGAVFSTAFIGLYILARCVEKIINAINGRRD